MTINTTIEERVRKLLALAGSSNPNEAALAADRAAQLIAEYSLDRSQLEHGEEREPIVRATLWESQRGPVVPMHVSILSATMEHFYPMRAIRTGNHRGRIDMIVRRNAEQLVCEMFAELLLAVENGVQRRRADGDISGRSESAAYRKAFVAAIQRRAKDLRTAREATPAEQVTALVRVERADINAEFEVRFGRSKSQRAAHIGYSRGAMYGFSDGNRASLGSGSRLGGRKSIEA